MVQPMDSQILFLLVLFPIIWACIFFLTSNSKHRKSGKLPPGPYPFPIIGNILQLGKNPYRSLAKLSQTYGPLMYLKIGFSETIVVSSPEVAKVVLQKYDQTFSSRTVPVALESIKHGKFSMAWLPVDNQWRKLRRIQKEQMFSLQRLDAGQGIRREKLHKLCDYVNQCCVDGHAVDIADATFTTSLNMISSTLFSVDFADYNSDSSQELKDVIWNVLKYIGSPNLGDYFPLLKYVDPQGISRRTKFYFRKLYAIMDGIIDQRLKSRGTLEKNDLLEALLDLYQKHEPELSRNEIKHILMDLFLGGTDTSPSTVEWAMAELLRNPKKMSKVKSELSDVIGENGVIQESDISKLPYLQAIVKETHRLHPIAPLLLPHTAVADVEINGYMVPKNARVVVNIWASSRDSNIWSSPDSFMPERFLDLKTDYNGQDFKFIPFSAGRRICPGLPFAHRVVHVMLATLIHNFDWRLEEGLKPEEIEMSEEYTTTMHKAIPLKAFPIKL